MDSIDMMFSTTGNQRAATEKALPDGVVPIYLGTETQKAFHVILGEDVTKQDPYTLLPSSEILAEAEAGHSEFGSIREAFEQHDGSESMLLVFNDDEEELSHENFLLCVTREAMDNMLQRGGGSVAKAAEEQAVRDAETKFISVDPGVAEREIAEWTVKPSRALLKLSVSRPRRHFGEPCKFGDREAHDGFEEHRPFKDPNYVLKKQQGDFSVQAVPTTSTLSIQTEPWTQPVNSATQYEARSMGADDQKQHLTQESMMEFLSSCRTAMEHALQQGETANLFTNDYHALAKEEDSAVGEAEATLKEGVPYPAAEIVKQRKISAIDWQPASKGMVAVAIAEKWSFDERCDKSNENPPPSIVLLWNAASQISPQAILHAPADVLALKFCPDKPHVLVGGLQSGQVVMWDLKAFMDEAKKAKEQTKEDASRGKTSNKQITSKDREAGSTPVVEPRLVSSLNDSHKRPVADVCWVDGDYDVNNHGMVSDNAPDPEKPENTGCHQFVSTAPDGLALFWDVAQRPGVRREHLWKPYHFVYLYKRDQSGDYGAMQLQVDCGSSRVIATTEEGELVFADIASRADRRQSVQQEMRAHSGACTALDRSPFFPNILLTVGDWSFNIWRDDVAMEHRVPLVSSKCSSNAYCTDGRWSPSRPGVFFIARSDGAVEVWDLLDKSHAPSREVNVTSGAAITAMAFTIVEGRKRRTKQFLAIGDTAGTLQVIDIPRNLQRVLGNELSVVQAFFEREVARVRYVQSKEKDNTSRGEVSIRRQAPREELLPIAGIDMSADEQQTKEMLAQKQEKEDGDAEREYAEFQMSVEKELGLVIGAGGVPIVVGEESV